MQTITVKPTSNNSGRAQRKATGAGKQRTIAVDFSKSEDRLMGEAAGTLANVLGWLPEHDIRRGERWGTFVNLSV